jgi:DNA helicase-2/ATP-dependent DNA helicase PcrA
VLTTLSIQQRTVIDSTGKNILKACPGSGKTYTVACKMAYLISSWSQTNAGIAALSFTNVASEEIILKLAKHSIVPSYPHFFGTIDSFVNKWIFLPYGHLVMKCKSRPNIVGLSEAGWELPLVWSWGKAHNQCYKKRCNLLDFTYNEDGELINTDPLFSKDACPYKMARCIELKMQFVKAGLATQSDAAYWAMQILNDYPVLAKALVKRFPTLIIDEAQDTSQVQMKLIDLLIQNGLEEITLIGDPDQAIYEWRNADPEIFLNKYINNEWNSLELTENRRSSQLICNATQPFSSLKEPTVAVGNTSDSQNRPILLMYKAGADEEFLKDKLKDICNETSIEVSPDLIAILCRGNSMLRKILKVEPDFSPWNDEITRYFAQATYYRDIKNYKGAMRSTDTALRKIYYGSNAHRVNYVETEIAKSIGLEAWRIRCWSILKNAPVTTMSIEMWKSQIQTLLNEVLARAVNLSYKKTTPVTRSVASFFVKNQSEDIMVETIHAAKGKTYDAVMVALSNRGKATVKQIATLTSADEELRNVYVAMTRPRKLLVVAIPDNTSEEYLLRFPKEIWEYRAIKSESE